MNKSWILWILGISGTSLTVCFYVTIFLDYFTIGGRGVQNWAFLLYPPPESHFFQSNKSYLESAILLVSSSLSTIPWQRVCSIWWLAKLIPKKHIPFWIYSRLQRHTAVSSVPKESTDKLWKKAKYHPHQQPDCRTWGGLRVGWTNLPGENGRKAVFDY